MKRFFYGGVHPPAHKAMSVGTAAPKTVIPRQAVIPLLQHIGVPCRATVRVGDYVRRGQLIGDGTGLCAPVHASVSGVVTAIADRPHPRGGTAAAIVIDNDFKEALEPCPEPDSAAVPDAAGVLAAVRAAGIVGMGGAAFPTDRKIAAALQAADRLDTVIANACECEPYITADDTLLRGDPTAVFAGLAILRTILSPKRTVIAIEDNKPAAIRRLREVQSAFEDMEVVILPLPTRYPQGSEKQLIAAVTGRQVPPGGLPADIGCLVLNVATLAAISGAVRHGTPLTERLVTVSGDAVSAPQNLLVRVGTPFADVIAAVGGMTAENVRILLGGPMMGREQTDLSVPVIKGTNAILCLAETRAQQLWGTVCIRCGACIDACPMQLQPLYYYRFTHAKQPEALSRLHIGDCMECGCCAYICPGKLPLTAVIRQGKALVEACAVPCS